MHVTPLLGLPACGKSERITTHKSRKGISIKIAARIICRDFCGDYFYFRFNGLRGRPGSLQSFGISPLLVSSLLA
jgi:hypothetical protein